MLDDKHGLNSEVQHVSVILPREMKFPTPGVTYETISDDVIKQIADKLMKGVFESSFRYKLVLSEA